MIDFPREGPSDRDDRGRFVRGNTGGRGNPHARRVGMLRTSLIRAVSDDDVRAIVAKLVELAREGDIRAAQEVLDRTIGKPSQTDVLQRLEAVENAIAERSIHEHC
jgi:hypothetical protein